MIRKEIGLICIFLWSGLLTACSSPTMKIDESSDVIQKGNKISNLHIFEKFVTNVETGKSDEVRIVNYTIEGDPIFQTLKFDGREIQSILDSSQDRMGGGNKKKKYDTCKKITIDKKEEEMSYRLNDCKKDVGRNGYSLLRVSTQ